MQDEGHLLQNITNLLPITLLPLLDGMVDLHNAQ